MIILIFGVALWSAAHLWKRLAPASRASFGARGRPLVTAALIVSILLMIWGYRIADGAVFWGPSAAAKGINNLLMLVSVYFFAASGMKTRVAQYIRHPMLLGMALWALAHLIPNGDVPSFVLFGGLLVWSLVEMVVINRAVPHWTKPPVAPIRKEVMALAGTLIVYAVISGLHIWLGYNPFGG